MLGLFFVSFIAVVISYVLCLGRSISCLIILETLNVLLLFFGLLVSSMDSRMVFITLLIIFTIEVTLTLIVLTRLWSLSSILDLSTLY